MNKQELMVSNAGLLTVSDVAVFFHCDRETVKRQARNGRLPGFKFGKTWLFRWCDINTMIDGAVGATHLEAQ